LTDLRRSLRKIGATVGVYKNSLVGRALASMGVKDMGATLEGPNAYVFSKDTIAGPKAVIAFARKNEKLVIKGGVIEGKKASAADIKTVSMLPGRESLISMFLSCLQSPISSFARTVQAVADKQN
jgi:large subunit ribosomal protein L10